jgi:hypothetical protein
MGTMNKTEHGRIAGAEIRCAKAPSRFRRYTFEGNVNDKAISSLCKMVDFVVSSCRRLLESGHVSQLGISYLVSELPHICPSVMGFVRAGGLLNDSLQAPIGR